MDVSQAGSYHHSRLRFAHWLVPEKWRLTKLLNRDLPADRQITLQIYWPLFLLPLVLLNQLLTPHPVWITLAIVLVGLYALSYLWIRHLVWYVELVRERQGTIMVAGDLLTEEFTLHNQGLVPVLWAAFLDHSQMPDYNPGHVVACSAQGTYRWRTNITCGRRGIYQLGPHQLILGDPAGLFRLTIDFHQTDTVIIYPRVAQLPPTTLPQGLTDARESRRRPLQGTLRAPTIRDYAPGDSLRYLHWPSTARQGKLMVTELNLEPSGDIWIVLDLNRDAHHLVEQPEHPDNTLEYCVVVAASLAAELLGSSEHRAVGLLTISGEVDQATCQLLPQSGSAYLWEFLATLAPIQASDVTLAQLLQGSRELLRRGRTLAVITSDSGSAEWVAELAHLQALGMGSSILLITPGDEMADNPVSQMLTQLEVPVQQLNTATQLPPVLTYRRTRTVVRNTPSGGAVTYEVEEEVG